MKLIYSNLSPHLNLFEKYKCMHKYKKKISFITLLVQLVNSVIMSKSHDQNWCKQLGDHHNGMPYFLLFNFNLHV